MGCVREAVDMDVIVRSTHRARKCNWGLGPSSLLARVYCAIRAMAMHEKEVRERESERRVGTRASEESTYFSRLVRRSRRFRLGYFRAKMDKPPLASYLLLFAQCPRNIPPDLALSYPALAAS